MTRSKSVRKDLEKANALCSTPSNKLHPNAKIKNQEKVNEFYAKLIYFIVPVALSQATIASLWKGNISAS